MENVLIVEDDPNFAWAVARVLRDQFEPLNASNAREALFLLDKIKPDVILLDLNLPDASGLDLCKRLRADSATRSTPIIMLTGEQAPEMRVEGLETGADDYVCKPFHSGELIARIKAQIRRRRPDTECLQDIQISNLRLVPKSLGVWVDGNPVVMTPLEFKLLYYIVQRAGTLIEREACLSDLWPGTIVSARTIDTHIARLRRKIRGFQGRLRTIHRAGYMLESGHGDGAHQALDERSN